MRTSHDDLTHPVPPLAYVRWKENYFFVILCPDQGVFGVAHINCEPGFERTRMACLLDVRGKRYSYKAETPIQENFGLNAVITDGTMTATVVRSHDEFLLQVGAADFAVDLRFKAHTDACDFSACRYGAPENHSFKEAMTFGTNLPFEIIHQSHFVTGTVTLGDTGEAIAVDGYGYRDHTWGMRTDNSVAWHTWSGLVFPDIAFGIMNLEIIHRPGIVAKEGFVADKDGVRVLSSIAIRQEGKGADGLPDRQIYDVADVLGRTYHLEADVSGRLGQVKHENEKGKVAGKPGYSMTENFCRIALEGHGAKGIGIVELGFQ